MDLNMIDDEILIYSIDDEKKTASIIFNKLSSDINSIKNINIPRSIEYESNEYIITNISEEAFKLSRIEKITFANDSEVQIFDKYTFPYSTVEKITISPHLKKICENAFENSVNLRIIEIPENSELQTIGRGAFSYTNIESLFIPPSTIELEIGCFIDAKKLNKIIIDPKNPRYSNYGENLIIGKSSIESENFDVLIFCYQNNVEHVTIPSFIRIIESYAFYECNDLNEVEIPINSELHTIKKKAFYRSSIKRLFIPSKTVNLEDGWCSELRKLNEVTVSPNNPRYAYIDEKIILEKSSVESVVYDSLVFGRRDIKHVIIPSFIKIIKKYAFQYCFELKKVELFDNSELQLINDFAFSCTIINNFSIPPHLKKIGKHAFDGCFKSFKVDVLSTSELRTISEFAFFDSDIESLSIPASTVELEKKWCIGTNRLNEIIIDPNNPIYSLYDDKIIIKKSSIELEYYDTLAFCKVGIKSLVIPKFIKVIEQYAFGSCNNLRKIEFQANSELQIIEENSFNNVKIENISIPLNVIKIEYEAFKFCDKLRKIQIPANSNLQEIGKYVFYSSAIRCFTITSKVAHIGENAFQCCNNLQIIEIDENSELMKIETNLFLYNYNQPLIMIPTKLADRIRF